ncbi:OmpA family protein [Aliiroseovarius subalbicans]|uniref:OmpA family protein n=1 Tax=Aliiroseovarius subalbicans TaxID=2925840 RepID=UPI001F57C3A8|nr:OmpA family protein [Aliiroseovarius subalbicans]MCI2397964.1 OmpA family protein [Aliiroseovarius subalbicans]
MKRLLAATSILALLAGCGDSRLLSSWTQEAGEFLDEGQFGNPTMNNTEIHSGDRTFLTAMENRFASEVTDTVNFEFNSARLGAEAQAVLRTQATWIRQFPEVRFRVYGHTDLVGSNAYNKRLGMRRARAVVNYLVSHGADRHRLEAVVSEGETQPLVVTEGRERRNRRTVTEVFGLASDNPMVLNGKYGQALFREYVESSTESRAEVSGKGPEIINTTETW